MNSETTYTKRGRHGPMHTFNCDNCIGESIRRYGEWAEAEISLLLSFVDANSVVLDVGANIGTHTVALAKVAKEVFAFEPQRRVFQVLCANIVANQLPNVIAVNAAVGGSDGVAFLTNLSHDVPANNLGMAKIEGEGEGVPVALTAIDSGGIARCDLIKADIEGYEIYALHGAERTIAAHRPVIYLEHHINKGAVETWLRQREYRLFYHEAPAFNPDNYAGSTDNFHGDYVETNLLAWPQEKALARTINEAWEI